ncbi:MAG: shikimate kinase [Clostridia bacterium]|nr:shikimate kinase [Clostridia bacterium]
MNNIILIGMPGSGKSTCGVLAAKALCKSFIDTDLLIQQQQGAPLQEIINQKDAAYFQKAEENCLCALTCENAVIAPGGSAVLSAAAMAHLKALGKVVYLKISAENMRTRIKNITTRGIVLGKGGSLEEMYALRQPLYEAYADTVIVCDGLSVEQVVEQLVRQ